MHHCGFKRLSTEQIKSMQLEILEAINNAVDKQGRKLEKEKYCELDFFTLLINAAANHAVNAIRHVTEKSECQPAVLIQILLEHMATAFNMQVMTTEQLQAVIQKNQEITH